MPGYMELFLGCRRALGHNKTRLLVVCPGLKAKWTIYMEMETVLKLTVTESCVGWGAVHFLNPDSSYTGWEKDNHFLLGEKSQKEM